jgi:peptidoglycan hydrolase-like protein with peptidoglycan-binding domain
VSVDDSINSNRATSTLQSFRTEGCSSGSATRVARNKAPEDIENSTNESESSSSFSLRTVWNEEGVSGAVARLLTEPTLAASEPELAIEILQSYLADMQVGTIPQSVGSPAKQVRDLYLDMTGDDVRRLQELLIEVNTGPAAIELARVGATGFFGSYTKNALGEYQLANGIVPYIGYFGSITRNEMTSSGRSGLWW